MKLSDTLIFCTAMFCAAYSNAHDCSIATCACVILCYIIIDRN